MLGRGADGVSIGRCIEGFAAVFGVMTGEVSQPRRVPAARPETSSMGQQWNECMKTAAYSLSGLITQIPL